MKIWILLAIPGRCIESQIFSTAKMNLWICISGRQLNYLGSLSSGSVTRWGELCSGQRGRPLRSQLSPSVGRWCTCTCAPPACLRIVCGAIVARKESGRVVLTMHSWVSFQRSLHLVMPRKLNTPLLLFFDLGMRILAHILRFLYCGARKPSFGHFGHIEGQAHIRLFQLYPTSLPCHSSRHVENLPEICCCFEQWDSAITSTIYASVASSKVNTASFVHSWGCLIWNSSTKLPELTTSWYSM